MHVRPINGIIYAPDGPTNVDASEIDPNTYDVAFKYYQLVFRISVIFLILYNVDLLISHYVVSTSEPKIMFGLNPVKQEGAILVCENLIYD